MNQFVTPAIRFTGIDVPSADLFEQQYRLPHGMSYNSYVIIDSKIAVMDSVEAGSGMRWIRSVEEATGGRQPDYLVVHHMEPDHSSCVAMAMVRWPGLMLVASAKAISMLPQFFPGRDFADRAIAVKEGDVLDLGTHHLTFYAAPMVHWPEVMVSYESSERVLFSADAFGKFGSLQYADEWINEARRYYMNIVAKYGNQVQSLLRKLTAPPIDVIAPLHGPVLRGHLGYYVKLYDTWSRYQSECRGVLVAYASIYGGTEEAAVHIADVLRSKGVGDVTVMNLCLCDMSEAVAQAFRHSAMVVAAPTYDAGIFPAMHDFLYHLVIKGYRNRIVGVVENGSWAPVAGRLMRKMLETLPGITFAGDTVTIRSRMTADDETALAGLACEICKGI